MNANQLLDVIGDAKDQHVLSAVESRERQPLTGRSFKKPILVAAIIAMTLALVGCAAVIYARINMRVVAEPQPQETVVSQAEGQPVRTVEQILTTFYPQSPPDGYRCVSGSGDGAVARYLTFQNDEGTDIIFAISTSVDFGDSCLVPPVEKKEVTVAGQNATLTIAEVGAQSLIWEDPEIGYYASLLTEDMDVDLVAMAESVGEGEPLKLTFYLKDGESWEAWYPQKLPEGYECFYVSDVSSSGTQYIQYHSDDGYFQFVISTSLDFRDTEDAPFSTTVRENVDIDGTPGQMVTVGDHQWMLSWRNEEEGFHALLETDTPELDLVEIARSVGPGKKLEATRPERAGYTVELEQGNKYVGYEPWYPQWLPEGYAEDYIGDRAYGEQEISYKNASCETIQYTFYFRLGNWVRKFESMEPPEQVDINGHVGYKIDQSVIWIDADRGFGFKISAPADVDILKMARSVAIGEEPVPTNADKTQAALKELGDYQITALPEGMVEDGLAGWPLEHEDDWYAYVRRWYFNKQTNAQIRFVYDTYLTDAPDGPKAVCKMKLGGDAHPLVEINVSGHDGYARQFEDDNAVVWAFGDNAKGMVFQLYSEDFSVEELVKIAQSVEKLN